MGENGHKMGGNEPKMGGKKPTREKFRPKLGPQPPNPPVFPPSRLPVVVFGQGVQHPVVLQPPEQLPALLFGSIAQQHLPGPAKASGFLHEIPRRRRKGGKGSAQPAPRQRHAAKTGEKVGGKQVRWLLMGRQDGCLNTKPRWPPTGIQDGC